MSSKSITGFSKLHKIQKIAWLSDVYLHHDAASIESLKKFWLTDDACQQVMDGFSENTVSNYILPFGLAPNFLIDGEMYCVPMVIEESSVVAAAASAAKYWMDRGGFKTKVLGTTKVGQIHFKWLGNAAFLFDHLEEIKAYLMDNAQHLTQNMTQRGGGVTSMELLDFSAEENHLFQMRVYFETCDSMGANFINSVLENFAASLENYVISSTELNDEEKDIDVIMAILSNYTPECLVHAEVSCPISDLGHFGDGTIVESLANKFLTAVKIAHIDPYRATTHNKGIFNGIDSVILATGNDFRATEAGGHAYACKSGKYRSLSHCEIENGYFRFWLEIPLAIGTVGGLTALHPLAKTALSILGNPSSEKLMRIIASVGLAQNFAAIRSLVTTGIQQGHMKMHIVNILNQLQATEDEMNQTIQHFEEKTVSFAGIRDFLHSIRNN